MTDIKNGLMTEREYEKLKEELRKTREDANKNVVAYEALYLNVFPP